MSDAHRHKTHVALQLDRVFTRFEFNQGFELDILAPKTWAAQWWARFVIEERLAASGLLRILEISARDLNEAAQTVADAIRASRARQILVIHTLDDGGDPQHWQPFFRRLNEVRNAIARSFVGNLVFLVAPRHLMELVGEAPDLWSAGAFVELGSTDEEELVRAMASHYPVLDGLTRTPREAWLAYVQDAGYGEFVDVLTRMDVPLPVRARWLFELVGDRVAVPGPPRRRFGGLDISVDDERLYFEVPGRWTHEGRGHVHRPTLSTARPQSNATFLVRIAERVSEWILGPVSALLDGLHEWVGVWDGVLDEDAWISVSNDLNEVDEVDLVSHVDPRWRFQIVTHPGPARHRELARLIDARQRCTVDAADAVTCCILHEGPVDDVERFARAAFDLVITVPPPGEIRRSWAVESGEATLAPMLRLHGGLDVHVSEDDVTIHRLTSVQVGGPVQLWLPGIDATELGRVDLYR